MAISRVANPGPAALWVLNPSKGSKKKMATRKRRTRRRTTARRHASNPIIRHRRRSTVASRRRRVAASHHRRRAANPARRHHVVSRRRRRNPSHVGGGLLFTGFKLAAGAALVQVTLGFVPPLGGVSPIADAARTAGVGWLLGMAMRKTGFGGKYADDVTLAGFTLAGGKLISSFVLPTIQGFFRPKAAVNADGSPATGVNGIGMYRPGLNPYGAYQPRGLNGLAVMGQGMNPFGAYVPMV